MSSPRPVPRHRPRAAVALAGAFALGLFALVSPACGFGGGGEGAPVARPRPGAVPTATLPANLPEPLLVGQTGAAPATTPGAGGGNTYTVKSGDTLFGIAASLGIPPAEQGAWANEVLRLNGIPDASRLLVGAELRLPAQTARPATTPAATSPSPPAPTATVAAPAPTATRPPAATGTPAPAPTQAAAAGAGTYTVQPGDFPHLIAEKLGVPQSQWISWSNELIALNNINPNAMQVGQVLRLPAGTPGR